MSAAHKNECRGGARQVVKKLSKRFADFIFAVACLTSIDVALVLVWLSLGAQAALLIWGALQ